MKRNDTDSLTREKKGKMPALSHLLSVGDKARVLSLAADGRYVYAGCQSADNEITVSWPDDEVGQSRWTELMVFSGLGLFEDITPAYVQIVGSRRECARTHGRQGEGVVGELKQ